MTEREQGKGPKLANWLLSRFVKDGLHEEFLGDLQEIYQDRMATKGKANARFMYWIDAIHLLVGFTSFKRFKNQHSIMFRHNILLSWRLLIKQKSYSLINIFGLSLSLTMAMFVLLWIQDEKSYDQFHQNIDRTYRVLRHFSFGEEITTGVSISHPVSVALREDYPEIEKLALTSHGQTLVFQREEVLAKENGLFAGPEFFEIFSWNLTSGIPSEVLREPSTVVLSTSLAEKYFGPDYSAKEVIGQTIQIGEQDLYRITGIFTDVPPNSTLQFDFVLSIDNYLQHRNITHWDNSNLQLYVLLQDQVNAAALSAAIKDLQNEHIEGFTSDLFLHPYQDMHLRSSFENGLPTLGRIEYYIRVFSMVIFLVVVISAINFTNLAIARSMQRAKEIGIRKVVGARRDVLAAQFLWESILLVLLSFVLASVLLITLLPVFNLLVEKQISLSDLPGKTWWAFAGIGVGTALLAGAYPALYLSSIKILPGLKAFFRIDRRTVFLRKGLVAFQFIISGFLIIGSITVYRQLKFIQNKNLGLEREQVVYFPLEGELSGNYEAFKSELLRHPGISGVTSSSQNPLAISNSTHTFSWPGIERRPDDHLHIMTVNYDFLDVMGIELHSGRDFEKDRGRDTVNYLINERLLEFAGFADPIGQEITIWGDVVGEVVGVVKDFHMSDFYSDIKPIIIRLRPQQTRWLFLRTENKALEGALTHIAATYREFNPNYPFEHHFLDERFEDTYRSEQVVGRLALCFTIFALTISCLGLLGLVILAGEQKLKEVSVRKILGASTAGIMVLLSKDLLKMVLISLAVAIPISFLLMQEWLNHFAFHVQMGLAVFALAGGLLLALTLLSISWYTFRVATSNPVRSLRSE